MGPQNPPNMPHIQRPYPTAHFPNPSGPVANPPPPGSFTPGRPREWETPDRRTPFERDNKRPRPFQPNPNDASFPTPQSMFNRNSGPPMPHMANQAPLNSHVAQMPRMPQNNNPPIHPPNPPNPFQSRQSIFNPSAMMAPQPAAALQQRDAYQFPKPTGQFPGQPPVHASFDRLPGPPRKDFRTSDQPQIPSSPIAPKANKMESNEDLDKPISFKDFLLKQPDTISPQDAKEKYDLYVGDFTLRKPNKFFDLHKDEEWFKERYDPDYVLSRTHRIKEEVVERAKDFVDLWRKGGANICAPDLSTASLDRMYTERHPLPAPVPKPDNVETKQAETKKETVKMEGEDACAEVKSQSKEENLEIQTDNKDEVKGETSTVKTEEPVDDGEGEVTTTKDLESDNVKISEHPESENLEGIMKDGKEFSHDDIREGVKDLMLPLRREHEKHTIFMRGIPINLNRSDLTEVLLRGPDRNVDLNLRRLKLGDINPIRGLERFGWAVYASEACATIALEKVRGALVKSEPKKKAISEDGKSDPEKETEKASSEYEVDCTYEIDCMMNLQRKKKYTQGRILPSLFGSAERMALDAKQSVKMMRSLDRLRGIDDSLNPLSDELLEKLGSDGERLDHVVTYLREVHYFCYYSGNEFLEDATSMPPQEIRPTSDRMGKTMGDAEHRVVRRVDERAKWVLDRDYDRPRSNSDHAELAKEKSVEEWLEANTQYESEGRFRCGLPPHKLFKGPEFVHKHLKSKHGDKMEAIKEKSYMDVYRANFENDPSQAEVISIYNDGLANAIAKEKGQSSRGTMGGTHGQGFGGSGADFGQHGANQAMGMYNAQTPFMGMGMQPFPMMLGYPGAYSATGYPNAMTLGGRGMNTGAMGGQTMMQMGAKDGDGMHRRGNSRGSDGVRDMRESGYRDGGFRDGGHRDGLHRGGRRGGHSRRGGDQFRRGQSDGRPLDPRASGPRRSYNDLDAPANGPSFDLVRYEDV